MHAEDLYRVFEHFMSGPNFNRALFNSLDRYFTSNSTLFTGQGPGSTDADDGLGSPLSSYRPRRDRKTKDKAGEQLREKREAAAEARRQQEEAEKQQKAERERLTADIKKRTKNFSIFTQDQLKEELGDLQKVLKAASLERKGLDYSFFGDLRRELDHLEHLEGNRGAARRRKLLTSNPFTGDLADMYYGRKDKKRERREQSKVLDREIQGIKDRITAIRDEMLDSSEKLEENLELNTEAIAGTQHVEERNNKLLKKMAKSGIGPGSGVGGVGGPGIVETLGQKVEDAALKGAVGKVAGAAMSGLGNLLKVALGLLATPEFIGLAALAVAAWFAHDAIEKALAKIRKDETEDQAKKARTLEADPRNSGKPMDTLVQASQLQATYDRTQQGPDGKFHKRYGANFDTNQTYKRKFEQARLLELAKQGMDPYDTHKTIEKEWAEANRNPNIDEKSAVWRILGKDLERDGFVKAPASRKVADPTRYPAAQAARQLTGLTSVATNAITPMQRRLGRDPIPSAVLQLGPGVNIDALNPAMRTNLVWMAAEYFAQTGKKLPINSGFRDLKKQQELYAKNPGLAAKPGTSLHEFGFAVDTDTFAADFLAKNGLLDKYGFVRNVTKANGELETWHLEPAGIQGQRAAILSGVYTGQDSGTTTNQTPPPEGGQPEAVGTRSAVQQPSSGVQGAESTVGMNVASTAPVPQTQYERTPYSTPGQSAALATADSGGGQQSAPSGGGGGGGGSGAGSASLSDIPHMVDNLPLVLYATGAVR